MKKTSENKNENKKAGTLLLIAGTCTDIEEVQTISEVKGIYGYMDLIRFLAKVA